MNHSTGPGSARLFTIWTTIFVLLAVVVSRTASGENNSNYVFSGTATNFNADLNLPMSSPGTNNLLMISNGGSVSNANAFFSPGASDGYNHAIVTDPNSTWVSSGDLYVGRAGSTGNNSMIISNGAVVSDNNGWSGQDGSAHNSVIVTAGGVWTNAGLLTLGNFGPNNSFLISAGGKVFNGSSAIVGNDGPSGTYTGNNALVTDPGSVWESFSQVAVGNNDPNSLLVVSNSARLIAHSQIVVGAGIGFGDNSQIIVAGGGQVSSVGAQLSAGSGAFGGDDGNSTLITGSGSVWSNSTAWYLGNSGGSAGRLIVADGGLAYVQNDIFGNSVVLGAQASCTNNSILVTGGGTLQSVGGGLVIGSASMGNSMIVSNGGVVISVAATVGNANNNSALVTGSGSLWTNANNIYVGFIGSGNQLTVDAGGTVWEHATFHVGFQSVASNNVATITGGGLLGVDGAGSGVGVEIGYAGANNTVIVTNGGLVADSGQSTVGVFGNGNKAIVTGPGSTWSTASQIVLGSSGGSSNQFIVSNGGNVNSHTAQISVNSSANGNSVLITDSGSAWTNIGGWYIGNGGSFNSLVVSNNGSTYASGGVTIGNNGSSNSNSVRVVAGGTIQAPGGIVVGQAGNGNQLIISGGGQVSTPSAQVGAAGNGAVALVSDPGSQWNITSSASYTFGVGNFAVNSQLIVTNGGVVHDFGSAWIGANAGNSNNNVTITGNGSLWQSDGGILVGAAGPFAGVDSHVLVTDGGTLEANGITGGAGGSGTVSNRGGIYQFSTSSPGISPNGSAIMITNGTIAYRNVTGADIQNAQVANITFQGDNTFQLKDSTNALLGSYTFDSVAHTANPANYQRLALVGNSAWQSTTLNVVSGGAMLISNATATVSGSLFDAGDVHVVNSKATFNGSVTISGTFRSDPSTNTFQSNVTVTASGSLAGGAGDLFDFKKSLLIASTNRIGFDLSASMVSFSGAGAHTNLLTGRDLGNNGSLGYPDGFTYNFSYGALTLGSINDNVYFGSGDGASSNALYVMDLLLPNNNTNWVSLLHTLSADINIYYGASSLSPADAYLGNQVYALDGGGFLLPAIPEPSAVFLLGVAGLLLGRWEGRRPR